MQRVSRMKAVWWTLLLFGIVATAVTVYLMSWLDKPPMVLRVASWFAPGLIAGSALSLRLTKWDRYRDGHCSKCGFDLYGLPLNSPCPECGNKP
jgi:hypothetical protein